MCSTLAAQLAQGKEFFIYRSDAGDAGDGIDHGNYRQSHIKTPTSRFLPHYNDRLSKGFSYHKTP